MPAGSEAETWLRSRFREVWLVDTEFRATPGQRPWPVCLAAHEYFSGQEIKLWRHDLLKLRTAPFDIGPNSLLVAYFASAEMGVFLELGWPLPVNILDLFAEFRCLTNGLELPAGNGLLGALTWFGLDRMTSARKEAMRGLIMAKAVWSDAEPAEILDYCLEDGRSQGPLLNKMLPLLDWRYALLQGRYMKAVAQMERTGVPIDVNAWRAFTTHWEALKARLIEAVDRDFHVYDGTEFRNDRFLALVRRLGIDWPLYPSGQPVLDGETFRDKAQIYPALLPLHELRGTMGKLRLVGLTIGGDARNRCLLSPYSSKTSRNQPSNSKFIFGSPRWMRALVRPPAGHAVAYIDWSGQEYAIAAALSGDELMIESYQSGDPHVYFAKANRFAPADATKHTHPEIREACKTVNLGVLYGLTWVGLAIRVGITPVQARQLLRLHRQTYRRYWDWTHQTVSSAMLTNRMISLFGWQYRIRDGVNLRSLQNWSMQCNGAEMMRVAAVAATEAGLPVCCPVHDAFLLCSPLDRFRNDVAAMSEIMRKAGLVVTGGVEVRTDVKTVRAPRRYMDDRGGKAIWLRATRLLAELRHG
jgi:DNA polymerase I